MLKFKLSKRRSSYSLLYHLIDHSDTVFSDNIHYVSTQYLYGQLDHIKKSFTFVPLEEHIEMTRKKKNYKNLVSVSIDDGYKATLIKGQEIFKNMGIPVTYFINTSIIEKGMFWRDKIRYVIDHGLVNDFLAFACKQDNSFEQLDAHRFYKDSKNPAKINSRVVDTVLDAFLADKGNLFNDDLYMSVDDVKQDKYFIWGNHTHNHYVLSSLTKKEQAEEIDYVERFFKSNNIEYSPVFSIPFGNEASFNDQTLELLTDKGYKGVVLSSGHEKKSAYDISKKVKKYDLGVINRFMPADIPSVL